MNEEIWKPIPRSPKYQASTLGRIRNERGRILTPVKHESRHKKEYRKIHLGRKLQNQKVHQIIAETFLGPKPEGCHVGHKDCDGANNCAANLVYQTHKENQSTKLADIRCVCGATLWDHDPEHEYSCEETRCDHFRRKA